MKEFVTAPIPSEVPDWLAAEMGTVPEVAAFAGTDEIAAHAAEIASSPHVRRRSVGRSAGGEELTCLTIGDDPDRHALVFGLPHPNEVVGGLTCLHLARRLAGDERLRRRLGLTWHLVPVIDPDGLRLNEGWLRGPFTRRHYSRHLYRQPSGEQIDWSFPVGGTPAPLAQRPPETRALMELIDRHRPVLHAALHNSELGEVYYYLGRDEPGLMRMLQRIPAAAGMALYRGTPEMSWSRQLADGIYRALDVRDSLVHEQEAGRPAAAAAGNSSSIYAARHGALSLTVEVPYWRDPRTSDPGPSEVSMAAALAAGGRRLVELGQVLGAAIAELDGLAPHGSPFLRAVRDFTGSIAAEGHDMRRRAAGQPVDRAATVAELASISDTVHLFRLRN